MELGLSLIPKAISDKFITRDNTQLCPPEEYNFVFTAVTGLTKELERTSATVLSVAGIREIFSREYTQI